MCKFWSAIVSRTGEVYHLGVITSHENVIKHFKLRDGDKNHICRIELSPRNEGEYLRPVTNSFWEFRIDEEERPAWFSIQDINKCWTTFQDWMKSADGQDFLTKYDNIQKWIKSMRAKTGEQLIYAEKLTPIIKKLILSYYAKGDSRYWDSLRDSVRGSVWDSVWDSLRDSVWDSVRDSLRDSVWGSVWDSVRDSVWGSVRGSVRDSVWGSVRDSVWDSVWDSVLHDFGTYYGDPSAIKLKLPADIFAKGVVHAQINSEVWVWGKKGKLLGKLPMPKKEKKP